MSSDIELAKVFAAANQYLKGVNAKIALVRRGEMLYWQGTLPPKPHSKRDRPYQQKFSSGLPYTKAGIGRAQKRAVIIGNQVALGEFDWTEYLTNLAPTDTAEEWIQKFEASYRRSHSLADSTWNNDWLKYLKRLPQGKPLRAEFLIDVCLNTPEDSATRSRCCLRLQALADYAGVEVDLLKYKGVYGRGKQKPRDLPSDELIQEWCAGELIPNKKWRKVLGIMATYGLRPHEVFLGEIREDDQFSVREGKTGPRLAKPFYPEWIQLFQIRDGELPNIDVARARTAGNLGKKKGSIGVSGS